MYEKILDFKHSDQEAQLCKPVIVRVKHFIEL